MGSSTRRASMTFYSDATDHYGHRVRIVLAEKGVSVEVVFVNDSNRPDDLADLNPYNELPVLVDRELSLYETRIMMEYIDERFPHPPLLPVYPVARAQARLLAHRIERDWSPRVDILLSGKGRDVVVQKARKELRDSLVTIAPLFNEKPFFMSEEFSLLDCMLAPILWRLPVMEIELPERSCRGMLLYMDRVFRRDGFLASLSPAERDMRRGG